MTDHKSAIYTALDALLAGDAARFGKIMRFYGTRLGSPISTRAYMRAWFRDNDGKPGVAEIKVAFEKSERQAEPPVRYTLPRPFPWAEIDRAIRFGGIKA